MGVILEGTSASVVFEIMVEDHPSFAGLDYAKLAEVKSQWPIVGRGDLYYGGTTYENKEGLGVQLSNAAQRGEKFSLPRVQKVAALRPKEKKLLAVPITKLYDRGVTVSSCGIAGSKNWRNIYCVASVCGRTIRSEGGRTREVESGWRERRSAGQD